MSCVMCSTFDRKTILTYGNGSQYINLSDLNEYHLTLKKVSNTCEPELAKRTKDKKVLKPPFSTAGPIFFKAFLLRSTLVPVEESRRYFTTSNLSEF